VTFKSVDYERENLLLNDSCDGGWSSKWIVEILIGWCRFVTGGDVICQWLLALASACGADYNEL
jgi:hypothetical protein